ncbi:hypothetical protein ES703_120743 [subsurface metagenome]
MAEEKPRVQKVLAHLYDAEGPARPKEIAESIGDTSLNVGKDLHRLKERGLAESEEEGQWKITAEGREWLESDGGREKGEKGEGKGKGETVPTQADLFRDIGERLRIGIGRGGKQEGTPLDAIIYYVQRTADFDNLTSVWNALTEMGVANDVKKRWIKLYAQNLLGKEIPEELKEKLEGGLEAEKVKVETDEVSPKPKRFIVVNNEIMGDPEGDLSFKEALQYVAEKKGASPAEAESLALQLSKQGPEMLASIMTMITPLITAEKKGALSAEAESLVLQLSKQGPEMITSIMNLVTPLITKEPPQQDNTMIQALQQRIEQLADDKHKAEMDSLRAEFKSGQRSPEADQQIQNLSQQINELRESLHNQELARIQEQNQALIGGLNTKITQLEQLITAGVQGKQADSKIGLMSETIKGLFEEAKGARQDIKALAPTFLQRSAPPKQRTTSEKAGFSGGLEKGIKKAQAAGALEDELFFGKQPAG